MMSIQHFIIILLLLLPLSFTQDIQNICQAGIRQDNTNYIHCGRKQLKEIPNFSRIPKTFYDELVLIDNQITTIPENAFQGLRVKRVNLSGNRIQSISPRAFRELSNYLEELILEFDPSIIQEIPQAIQSNLINLRSLKLIQLNFSKIDNRTFSQFRKLEHLTIRKSNIHTLESDAFFALNNLRSLNLDQNHLTDSCWNALIKHSPQLEILTLSQNQFKNLKNIHFPSLKHLDLSSNGLEIIENNRFPSLEKFYLQNNELNSLQLTFLSLVRDLKELNLDFNRLTFLPENIFQMNSKLISLSMQGNDLNYLTNYSLRGLKNLLQLNLARNRLQFQINQRPFRSLTSLKILNLDRNFQMNLTQTLLDDLNDHLTELSLQNCNLTTWNFSLASFIYLQRLKFSSNYLENLPENFLPPSIVSLDLQRNLFRKIPNFFSMSSLTLVDLDLSANLITSLDEHQLRKYPNLKTIGLTGNPLDCNCHLRWIKQWLEKNYDRDLIKFLQWTCAKPMRLVGKQLTTISEMEMSCNEEKQPSSTTSSSSSIETLSNELILNDIVVNSSGRLILSWQYPFIPLPKYYQIEIYDEHERELLYQRLIPGHQQSIDIDISFLPPWKQSSSSKHMLCIHMEKEEKKSCRKISLSSNSIQSASLILSSSPINKQQDDNEQYLYLIGGILLGAILVCTILILVCYCRLQWNSEEKFSSSSTTTNIPRQDNSIKTFVYHPLNVISYPSQQTSECSLHSSTDTSHSSNHDPYHLYQQIPSIHNCQIYSTRTHVLI